MRTCVNRKLFNLMNGPRADRRIESLRKSSKYICEIKKNKDQESLQRHSHRTHMRRTSRREVY